MTYGDDELRMFQEQAADKFRYIMWGTFDDPDKFPPKGEFFCKYRAGWMPEVPGKSKICFLNEIH
jgi:hypothetical protein